MNAKLENAQHRFMESLGKLCDSFGLNRFFAQLYVLLYLSDKPLSLDEISERLKVSKGNTSLNIRELEKWGVIRSVLVTGSRKDYYEAELDVKKVFLNKFNSSIQKRLSQASNMIDEFNKIVDSTDGELTEEEKRIAKIYKERLKKFEELKTLASTALSMGNKFFRI